MVEGTSEGFGGRALFHTLIVAIYGRGPNQELREFNQLESSPCCHITEEKSDIHIPRHERRCVVYHIAYELRCEKIGKREHRHVLPVCKGRVPDMSTVSACREETDPGALLAGNRPLLATIFDPSVTSLS